jgi:hypothetical protein
VLLLAGNYLEKITLEKSEVANLLLRGHLRGFSSRNKLIIRKKYSIMSRGRNKLRIREKYSIISRERSKISKSLGRKALNSRMSKRR